MKFMRRVLATVLAVILLIGDVQPYNAAAQEDASQDATVMEEGTSYQVSMDAGEQLYYKFTPAVTGTYIFSSDGDYDLYASLMDNDGNTIESNDDGGEDYNFLIEVKLTAGITYTLEVDSYDDEVDASVMVVRQTHLVLEYDERVTVFYGEDSEIHVEAECEVGDDISYQWYRYDEEEEDYIMISGATTSQCTLKAADMTSALVEYKCVVMAGSQTKTAYIDVIVDSELSIDYQKYQYGLPGDSIELKVNAQSRTNKLSYKWYYNDPDTGETVDMGTDSSIAITLAESIAKSYYCEISDGIQTKLAEFSLEVGTQGEKRVKSISLSGKQKKYTIYEISHKYIPFYTPLSVTYEDGTNNDSIYNGYQVQYQVPEDENGDWIQGKYTAQVFYKGAVASWEFNVIRKAQTTELQTEQEVSVQTGADASGYQCYRVSPTETGTYGIKLSDITGSGLLTIIDASKYYYYNREYAVKSTDTIECPMNAGQDYYLVVSSSESTTVSCRLNVTKDYWKEITLNQQEDMTETAGGYNYYKYTPERNGLYKLAGVDKEYRWANHIYNEDMRQIYEADGGAMYLTAGKMYYFKINNFSKEIILQNVEYVDYASSIVAAGRYEQMNWMLDEEGTLSIHSENGKMPATPWTCFRSEIKKLELGDELEEIQNYAFMDCTNLQYIQLPKNIKTIGAGAFQSCSSLEEISLPSSLTEIEKLAFYYCKKLNKVTLQEKNGLTYVGINAFEGTAWFEQQGDMIVLGGVLLKYKSDGEKTSVEIPQHISYIGPYAYSWIRDTMKEITIPNTLKGISDRAFDGCSKLENVTIPGSVTNIAYRAFNECTALESVVLKEGVQSLDEAVFWGCDTLKTITIPKSVQTIGEKCIGYKFDWDSYEVKRVENLPTIYCYADSAAYQYAVENNIPYQLIGSVTIHFDANGGTGLSQNERTIATGDNLGVLPTVTRNGYMFKGWYTQATGGTKVSVHTVVTTDTTFYAQWEVTNDDSGNQPGKQVYTLSGTNTTIILPASVYSYDGKAKTPTVSVSLNGRTLTAGIDYTVTYKNNTNIGTASVIITGKGSYTGTVTKTFTISAKKGTNFTVGAYKYKITSSSEVAFAGLKSAKTTKVVIPKTVKIGGKTFKVTSVAVKALYKKTKVTSVAVGSNIKEIGASAFEGCTKLTKVTMGSSVTKLGNKAFRNCGALKSLTVPVNVTGIGSEAFCNCKKLVTLTIKSNKLKSVGKNAFKGIKATARIKVPSKKLTAYKKLLKKKGQGNKVKIIK